MNNVIFYGEFLEYNIALCPVNFRKILMAMDSYDFSWQWIASQQKEENFTKIKSNISVKLDIESDSFLGLSTFNLCDKCPYQERNQKL